jgi:ketosteroid isomerase-like protein
MSTEQSIEPAPELHDFVLDVSAAWRAGDQERVLSFMSADPATSMGGPGGAVPMAQGREAVIAMVRQIVRPLPEGAGVFPQKTSAYKSGDFSWVNSDGVLRLPEQPDRGWSMVMVLRREAGAWKFVHFGAFLTGG